MSATQTSFATSFYVVGGTVRRDALCYVQRNADSKLYKGLKQGRFCYVLTLRQMGKSSLMVQTAARLREEGVTVAMLDRRKSTRRVDGWSNARTLGRTDFAGCWRAGKRSSIIPMQ